MQLSEGVMSNPGKGSAGMNFCKKVQKRPESQGIALPHHFILSVFFLPPQKGGKAAGFKAGNGTGSALHLRRSRGVLPLASIDGESGSWFGA